MDKKQKEMYLKSIQELVSSFNKLDISTETTSSDDEPIHKPIIKPKRRRITFVDMKYRYNHVFTKDDQVKLKNDEDVIKVLVKENKKWKHVAYVDREDIKWLQSVDDFTNLPLKWVNSYKTQAFLRYYPIIIFVYKLYKYRVFL
jgi:hypothetical protein